MRILIADRFPKTALAAIETDGARCEYRPGVTAEELSDAVDDADVLRVHSTTVDARTIADGRLVHGVNGVREPAPEPLLDAAMRS
jgi:D-3-phosphoglycerate dehydrogenase / 2-oxoglutarate reductase